MPSVRVPSAARCSRGSERPTAGPSADEPRRPRAVHVTVAACGPGTARGRRLCRCWAASRQFGPIRPEAVQ